LETIHLLVSDLDSALSQIQQYEGSGWSLKDIFFNPSTYAHTEAWIVFMHRNSSMWFVQVNTVTVAGTPIQAGSLIASADENFALFAPRSNTGKVFVSNSALGTNDPASRIELQPGDTLSLRLFNANLIWLDAEQSGSKVTIFVETR
jgi:hypothetical protein